MPTTTRLPSTAAARRLRAARILEPASPALPAELADALTRFQPGPPLNREWDRLRPVIADVMARSSIRGADSFRKYLTHLGYFLLWADDQGLPLTAVTVARVHTDEYARIGMPGSSEKSRADRRARLRWLADQVNPGQAPDKGVPVSRPTIRPPYTDHELSQVIRTALIQPTPGQTRRATICVGLGAGAGLDSADFRGLRGEHVVDSGRDGIVVRIPGRSARTVPVRRAFESLVRTGMTGRAPDQLLLGRVEDRRNLAANSLADIVALGGCPRIQQSRLRATWLAALLRQPVPLDVLLTAAGLRSARTLPDLFPHLEPVAPNARAAWLRGGEEANA